MIEQLIPLATGGLGGLLGGNVAGSLFRGTGFGSRSLVGIIAGAAATYFFGPTYGPMIGGLISGTGIESILGNLVVGAGGGAGGSILAGILGSIMGGKR